MEHLCESRHSFIVLYYYHDHVYHDYLQQHIAHDGMIDYLYSILRLIHSFDSFVRELYDIAHNILYYNTDTSQNTERKQRKKADLHISHNVHVTVTTVTRLAQLEERSTFNRVVEGSIPSSGVVVCCHFC
jgi:hypothetical protein